MAGIPMTVTGNGYTSIRKRKTKTAAFIALVSLGLILVFAVFAGWFSSSTSITPSSSNSQESSQIESVDFTCLLNANVTFTLPVAVNLDDGMNSVEAVKVADSIFAHEMTNATYVVKSAEADAEGIWTVKLSWGLVVNGEQESLSHFFDVVIDPSSQAVTYSRCY